MAGAIATMLVLGVGYFYAPPLRHLQSGDPFSIVWAVIVASLALYLLTSIFRWTFQRTVIELDRQHLTCRYSPLGFGKVSIPVRNIRQIYVSRQGHLRCQVISGAQRGLVHHDLCSGRGPWLRYVEQVLEQQLNLEDQEVAGEWRASDWILPEWKTCPKCKVTASSAEVQRQLEPLERPPFVQRHQEGQTLSLHWNWRGPQMAFLTVWLGFWNAGCLVAIWAGLSTLSKGNWSGLGVFLIPHIWIGAGMSYYYLCLWINQTRIASDSNRLRLSVGPLPWFRGTVEVDPRQVTQLYSVAHRSKNSVTYSLEAELQDGSQVTLFRDARKGLLDYVEQEVESHLNIANTR